MKQTVLAVSLLFCITSLKAQLVPGALSYSSVQPPKLISAISEGNDIPLAGSPLRTPVQGNFSKTIIVAPLPSKAAATAPLMDPCVEEIQAGNEKSTMMPAAMLQEQAPLDEKGYFIYRSPQRDRTSLMIESIMEGRLTIRITASGGSFAKEYSYLSSSYGQNFFELDLTGFASGAYFVEVICDNKQAGAEKLFIIK